MTQPAQVKKAEAAIKHFEATGRDVVSVAFQKDGFKLEFARQEEKVNPVDLINMGEK